MYYGGFMNALKKNNLLHYHYDANGAEPLNKKKLIEYPILCVNGSWEPVFNIVKFAFGKQFIAEINPESLFPQEESERSFRMLLANPSVAASYCSQISKLYFLKIYKLLKQKKISEISFLSRRFLFKKGGFNSKDYFEVLKAGSKYFNIFFSPSEEDLNTYFGKPCYWFPGWANTDLLDDITRPVSDKLGFIGSLRGERIKFFSQDKNKIIELANTAFKDDPIENAKELCKLINKYRFLVCPMGVRVRTMPGKVFEYMACKRLCFSYLNESYMFKSGLLFGDGKEVVYFKNFKELERKYNYYLQNKKEAEDIAEAGYRKVRQYFNADVMARWFAEIVLRHANGGKFDESYNNFFNN